MIAIVGPGVTCSAHRGVCYDGCGERSAGKGFCQVSSIALWTRSRDHQGARSEKTELQTVVVTQEGRAPVTPTVNLRDRREADILGREMPGLSLCV